MADNHTKLAQLVDELREDTAGDEVAISEPDAHVTVYLSDGSKSIKIKAEDATVLFDCVENTERLVETLDLDEDSHVAFSGLILPPDVIEYLEMTVSTVEEQ